MSLNVKLRLRIKEEEANNLFDIFWQVSFSQSKSDVGPRK